MKMLKSAALAVMTALSFLLALVVTTAPANAQATRTWVSGVGDDANPCSRTAPCKTFAGAISKTAAGGEINCLDPGGFGAVTITKAMTIACPYTEGGALAGGNGIVINAGANDSIYLRGLDIFGVTGAIHGVRFLAGGSLHIEDSVIRRFNGANGFGISFIPSGASKLYVSNVTVANNGVGGQGGGILVEPTGTGTARVALTNVRLINNANVGFRANSLVGIGAQGVAGELDAVTVSGTTGEGVQVLAAVGAPAATFMLVNSAISSNTGIGVQANGTAATLRVANTSITANGTGVTASAGGSVRTYGNNQNDGNTADGAFTLPIIPQE